MYFNQKLWSLTITVRRKILTSVMMGVGGSVIGITRLLLLGWLLGKLIAGDSIGQVWLLALATLITMLAYGLWEYQRLLLTQKTAAIVQHLLRTKLFDQIVALGPSYFAAKRSGEVTNAAVEGVEQLEVYFGRYLPQLFVAAITPIVIFAVVSQIDLPVAFVLLCAAIFTLFAPSLFQRWDSRYSMQRAKDYRTFASEFLDALQGLVTLKAFGQSKARETKLAEKAHHLFQSTMWVMSTNSLARGITDIGITLGAASALSLSAYRVSEGLMSFESLLLVLLLGVEVFKPLRELRSLMHAGMLAESAAKQVFSILDAKSDMADHYRNAKDLEFKEMSVSFEQVSFAYDKRSTLKDKSAGPLVHDNLSFNIAPGQQIGVVGSSGGGKSTILNLLMRFYQPQSGTIRIGGIDIAQLSLKQLRSQFAIVSQNTHLFHGTVKENLLLGAKDVSDERLMAATQAANAHEFIEQLDGGYNSIIGERGVRLSGGQRQRIAIARALLRDAPILILDEALSSVDAKNEAHIQIALEHLMKGRTTLILAHRLASVINCDQIILLDKGRVAEIGSHTQLLAKKGGYAQLMASQLNTAHKLCTNKVEVQKNSAAAPRSATINQQSLDTEQDNILQGDKHSWRQVITMLLSFAVNWKGRLIGTFILGTSRVFTYIAVSVFSALAAAAVKNGTDYSLWLQLLVGSAIAAAILHWLESWLAHDMAFRMLSEMRIKLFQKLESLAPAFMVRHRSGDLINLATHDVEMVEYFFAHTIAPVFVAILVPSTILILIANFSTVLALTLLPFILLVFVMPILFRKRIDEAANKARVVLGSLSAHTVESLQGLSELLNYQATDKRREQFEILIEKHKKQRMKFFKVSAGQSVLVEFITLSSALLLLVIGAPLASAGAFDSVYLPLIALVAVMAFLPVIEVADVGRQLSDTLAATSRLIQVEESEPSVKDNGTQKPILKSANSNDEALKVEFKGISFSYVDDLPKVTNKLDLVLEAGSKVALVGASGAGKSTLAHLLMRFWDPQAGAISIDGTNIKDMPLDHFRQFVAIVAQDTYLFNDTIRENLLMAKPQATQQELLRAVNLAQLADFVAGQKEGLDTIVGERGFSLSGGQRQRLSIARAFLRDAPILILDEATSHLDAISEAAVHKALRMLMKHRTTLVIAHRLASIEDADKIVVLDQGTIIEQGTHQQLLSLNGEYAKLQRYQQTVIAA
ncbi:MAG: thiol reductant ABC exporter CydC subunit [Oceanospirillaceae bacterium]|jgi:thiol reductant ABC exporter CydC subunit